ASTRSRVPGVTRGLPEKASDAVDGDTPARAATAASVGRPDTAPTLVPPADMG
ncbi:MAG: hypothetical protein QOG20_5414, partial [Pseudonocardiales bacterium]|nr:hypothetical protein [Pseudonocardiales bacterium]